MATVRLNWTDNNTAETEHKVYRDTSTMNPNSLPAALTTLGVDVVTYDDTTAAAGTTYYYRVSAIVGGVEYVSDEVSLTTATAAANTLDSGATASYVTLSETDTRMTVPTYTPPSGMDVHYDMQDSTGASGTLPDLSGNSNDATLSNMFFNSETFGESAEFDGLLSPTEYVECPVKTNSGDYTISVWVNHEDRPTSGTQDVFGENASTSSTYGANITIGSDGTAYHNLFKADGTVDDASGGTVPLTTWTHMVATRENNVSLKIYLNGVEVGTDTTVDQTTTSTYNGRIGRDRSGAASAVYDGKAGNFRLWSSDELSAAEILTLYNYEKNAFEDGNELLGYYTSIASSAATGNKFYWEIEVDTGNVRAGIGSDLTSSDIVGDTAGSYSWGTEDEALRNNSITSGTTTTTIAPGDVMMVAYDAVAQKLWFGVNGTWADSGDPAAGTGEQFASITGSQKPALSISDGTSKIVFASGDWTYTAPTGFVQSNA